MTPEELKAAADIDRHVAQLGGHLSVEGKRLRVTSPRTGLSYQLRTDIFLRRKALIHWLTHGRPLLSEEQHRHELLSDPRPGQADKELWERAFRVRYNIGGQEDELLHVLRTIRYAGASMVTADRGIRIIPGSALEAEWPAVRREWLLPHKIALCNLLGERHDRATVSTRVAGLD